MFIGFCIISLLRLMYAEIFFGSIRRDRDNKNKSPYRSSDVSIVIAAKNEVSNLRRLIPLLLNQTNPAKEIIIIDDYSSDDLGALKQQYPEITWLLASQDNPGKKTALTDGIDQVKTPLILLTDADCLPDKDWVKTMLFSIGESDVLLGYGPMIRKKGWLNTFIRYETVLTALQYYGFLSRNIPFMGVGRNLLYKKSIFNEAGGFESHRGISSGDDDLFVQSILHKAKIGAVLDKKSWVFSEAKESVLSFLKQKTRHISTSFEYQWYHKALLAMYAGLKVLWWVLWIVGIGLGQFDVVGLGVLFWIIMSVLLKKVYPLFDAGEYKFLFPLLDFGMALYYTVLSIFAFIRRRKGRLAWN